MQQRTHLHDAHIIVGVAEAYGNFFLPGTLAPVVPYALFILMLLFRPSGLFGEA